MASTHYVLEDPREDVSAVLKWFRGLRSPPTEVVTDRGLWLQFGPLVYGPGGEIDVEQSPLVAFFPSRVICGVLWSAVEVHFRAKGASPGGKLLSGVQREFRKWLALQDVVFEQTRPSESRFAHYLEGGIQNFAAVVYALPSGVSALQRGQYFVCHSDDESGFDRLCRTLKLRGVDCVFAQQPA